MRRSNRRTRLPCRREGPGEPSRSLEFRSASRASIALSGLADLHCRRRPDPQGGDHAAGDITNLTPLTGLCGATCTRQLVTRQRHVTLLWTLTGDTTHRRNWTQTHDATNATDADRYATGTLLVTNATGDGYCRGASETHDARPPTDATRRTQHHRHATGTRPTGPTWTRATRNRTVWRAARRYAWKVSSEQLP